MLISTSFRSFYPTYALLYQAGVFISRSSTPFLRLHNLYLPSLLQCLNLVLLTMQSLFDFIPNVWIIFLIIFWEGLLGGAVYVNTFAEVGERYVSCIPFSCPMLHLIRSLLDYYPPDSRCKPFSYPVVSKDIILPRVGELTFIDSTLFLQYSKLILFHLQGTP